MTLDSTPGAAAVHIHPLNANAMTPEQYVEAERIRKQLQIPVPVSKLIEFMRMFSGDRVPDQHSSQANGYQTRKAHLETKRRELAQLAVLCDRLMRASYGTTNKLLFYRYNGSVDQCATPEEVEERLETVRHWMQLGAYD